MHPLEPLFIFFRHFFPFTFYSISHSFDLLPLYFDFFFFHSTSIPQVFSYPILPASNSLSHPPRLLSSLPLATSLLSFSFGPLLFPPFRLAAVCNALLLMKVYVQLQREWHHVTQSFLHISEGTSRIFLRNSRIFLRNSLIINWNKTALSWACVYAYHLLSKWYNKKQQN